MRKRTKIILIVAGALVALALSFFLAVQFPLVRPPVSGLSAVGTSTAPERTPITSVSYTCADNKTIRAAYYNGPSKPPAGPGMPPTPVGSVDLVLSDGRTFTLPQTISADGTRYANGDESFIFWSKGDGAFVMERDTESYGGCVQ